MTYRRSDHHNHNHENVQCVLGLGKCESLAPAIGFSVNAFGPSRDSCLHWGSKQEHDHVLIETTGKTCLARIAIGNTLLIGKFVVAPLNTFWANNEGAQLVPVSETDQDIEFLSVDPACPVPWIPYTAGESLPFGVISGGHLSDGSITYVSKVIVNGYTVFDYYHARSELACYEYGGAQTTTSMELLVLL